MRKCRFGDRYDGFRIRKCDPTNIIIPYLMKERCDSQVFLETEIDIAKLEAAIKKKRAEGLEIGLLDYIIAGMVRNFSQYPRINRFIAGRRLYARNEILFSIAVKKALDIDTPETIVKFAFKPDSTIYDVNSIIRSTIAQNKGVDASNSMDKFLSIVNHLPRLLFSAAANFVTWLDFHGIMPKFIHKVSPFHTSIFITNMGSIGTDSVFHHIYNWGTTSIFLSLGTKHKVNSLDKDGNIKEKKMIKLRFVVDERIVDGFYWAKSLKYYTHLLLNPELLETPPEQVFEDDQI